jgi:hypothetical protein
MAGRRALPYATPLIAREAVSCGSFAGLQTGHPLILTFLSGRGNISVRGAGSPGFQLRFD